MGEFNAYIDKDTVRTPLGKGVLSGRTFSIKDVIAVEGVANGAGNPDWLRTARPALDDAPVVTALRRQGAELQGRTITDEMMYSLNGENYHYGTPQNPKAPDRIPGGSSSGSASAVAGGCVDFALGTDTGGSVRIPAAYCGLYGFRPTHGALPIEGVIPLAKSFDTIGWMAEEPKLMKKIGDALLDDFHAGPGLRRVVIPEEPWELLDPELQSVYSPLLSTISSQAETVEQKTLTTGGLKAWAETFRTMQAMEIWQEHGEWIQQENPGFGPDIAQRFSWAATLDQNRYSQLVNLREQIQSYLSSFLKNDTILVLPTTPGPAPIRNQSLEEMNDRRAKTMQLTSIAGLGGLPQLTVPVSGAKEAPAGISLIAGRFQDKHLLKWGDTF
ncbi:amidase [Salibacterium aidingense]|uniref:amidase n=1 Tax=Salibacterium aidingense TaxID=384933 RepID=UPI00047A1D1D|nr:amidase [Salibacterium aidingense]